MTSTFQSGIQQTDGRSTVTETHVDDLGRKHVAEYLSQPDDDRNAIMTARAVVILESLKEREVDRAIDGGDLLLPEYQTGVQFIARWRERFRNARREDAVRMAKWILDAIGEGRVTVNQVRTAFGLTAQQWTTLQTKLAAWRDALALINNAEGE